MHPANGLLTSLRGLAKAIAVSTWVLLWASPGARADDIYVDEMEITGGGITMYGGVSADALYINGMQMDDHGTITVDNESPTGDQSFNSLTFSNWFTTDSLTIEGSLDILGTQLSISGGDLMVDFTDDENNLSSETVFTGASSAIIWHWPGDTSLNELGNLTVGDVFTFRPGNFTLTAGGQTIALSSFYVGTPSTSFSSSGYLTLGGGNIEFDASNFSSYQAMTLGSTYLYSYYGLKITGNGSVSNITILPTNQAITINDKLALLPAGSGMRLATGNMSMAVGMNASVAFPGNGFAFGNSSYASGAGDVAFIGGTSNGGSPYHATALGNNSTATSGSTALSGGTAYGVYALAIGPGTVANSWGETVLGRHDNDPSGTSNGWAADSPALVVGNGNNTVSTNSLVILNNGNTSLNGNLTLAHPSYVSATSSTQPQELTVNGASVFNGTVTLGGNVTLSQRRGDISMGHYGN